MRNCETISSWKKKFRLELNVSLNVLLNVLFALNEIESETDGSVFHVFLLVNGKITEK